MSELKDFEGFLTAEDSFRMEMETYIPEFLERMNNDTMQDEDFMNRTRDLMKLGEAAGIDLQQYIIDYGKVNGIE